jgi:ketosteroid isomerase-like protein
MSNLATARAFFEACESGRGWDGCRAYCTPDAAFSAQAGALAEVRTVEQYAEWMKGILSVLTDGHYALHAFAEDLAQGQVVAFATFIGTHKVGGPVPPTGKTTRTDYVYAMRFHDGKLVQMTKIWNDSYALKELGWA